jgi:SAM-dependent methyltransferase
MGNDIALANEIRALLACARCHGPLDEDLACANCGVRLETEDGVLLSGTIARQSFFDDKFTTMAQGHSEGGGEWELCYRKQVSFIEGFLRSGWAVVDVGCGPALTYRRRQDCLHIGIEPSLPSIKVNYALDLRLHGSADAMPLASHSIDAIICLYSVHHMIGRTVQENVDFVKRVFTEFGRVVKPDGHVLIFEMIPWMPMWIGERMLWNTAKRLLGSRLDMYFWADRALSQIAQTHLGASRKTCFRSSPFLVFPPVFSVPWLKLPRFLYPLSPKLHHWQTPGPGCT